MDLVLGFSLLFSIFCCLIGVLYLYKKLTRTAGDHEEQEQQRNALFLDWLLQHQLRLPSVTEILTEINSQARSVTPVLTGEQWSNLTIERLLPGTDLPVFQIVRLSKVQQNSINCDVLVEWPNCMPGLEVTALVQDQKITCHSQMDWIIMRGNLTLEVISEGGVTLSWQQTAPFASAMSCLVVAPDQWKADIDIMEPISDNRETEASENLASSITEGLLQLMQQFQLNGLTLPLHKEEEEGQTDEILHHQPVEEEEAISIPLQEDSIPVTNGSSSSQQQPIEQLITVTSDPLTASELTTPIEVLATPPNGMATTALALENTPTHNDDVSIDTETSSLATSEDTPPSGDPIITITTNGGPHSSKMLRSWLNELPVINEPEEEVKQEEEVESSSAESTPLGRPRSYSWRRDSYEKLEEIAESSASPDTPSSVPRPSPPSFLKVAQSEEDLFRTHPNRSSLRDRRTQTLSVRSYDTDTPVTDSSGHLPSTLVYEVKEGSHKRHVVALSVSHASKLRKQLPSSIKLHIYNDHIFTATHIKGKQLCEVCNGKVTGLFGKQCYICRDCSIIVHKECHFKIESPCHKSKVSQMCLIYPDNISSISQF